MRDITKPERPVYIYIDHLMFNISCVYHVSMFPFSIFHFLNKGFIAIQKQNKATINFYIIRIRYIHQRIRTVEKRDILFTVPYLSIMTSANGLLSKWSNDVYVVSSLFVAIFYICLIGLYIRYEWLDVDRRCIHLISIKFFHLMH